jgi:hypothetical protein
MELVKELNDLQLSIFKILFRTTFDKCDNGKSSQDYHETSPSIKPLHMAMAYHFKF